MRKKNRRPLRPADIARLSEKDRARIDRAKRLDRLIQVIRQDALSSDCELPELDVAGVVKMLPQTEGLTDEGELSERLCSDLKVYLKSNEWRPLFEGPQIYLKPIQQAEKAAEQLQHALGLAPVLVIRFSELDQNLRTPLRTIADSAKRAKDYLGEVLDGLPNTRPGTRMNLSMYVLVKELGNTWFYFTETMEDRSDKRGRFGDFLRSVLKMMSQSADRWPIGQDLKSNEGRERLLKTLLSLLDDSRRRVSANRSLSQPERAPTR
jgi:hypothetical protein